MMWFCFLVFLSSDVVSVSYQSCPAGTSIFGLECIACAVGTYSAQADSVVCGACATGSYASVTGLTECRCVNNFIIMRAAHVTFEIFDNCYVISTVFSVNARPVILRMWWVLPHVLHAHRALCRWFLD